jgi:hypothetical protein
MKYIFIYKLLYIKNIQLIKKYTTYKKINLIYIIYNNLYIIYIQLIKKLILYILYIIIYI